MANEIKRDTVDYRDPTPFDNTKLNSLSDISKALRHKTYGEDTREAIAQQGEALVKLMQETGGDQTAEVKEARGPYELLGIRETAQEEAIMVASSRSESAIALGKSAASGSPRGAFDNLAALKTRFPEGSEGIYVTRDNGHFYYWNNSDWRDGGVYQGIALPEDYFVAKEKAKNLKSGTNLINLDRVKSGISIDTSGAELAKDGASTTDYIVIDSSSSYSFKVINPDTGNEWLVEPNDDLVISCYDKAQNFVNRYARITPDKLEGISFEGISFVRISIKSAKIKTMMFGVASYIRQLINYAPYEDIIAGLNLERYNKSYLNASDNLFKFSGLSISEYCVKDGVKPYIGLSYFKIKFPKIGKYGIYTVNSDGTSKEVPFRYLVSDPFDEAGNRVFYDAWNDGKLLSTVSVSNAQSKVNFYISIDTAILKNDIVVVPVDDVDLTQMPERALALKQSKVYDLDNIQYCGINSPYYSIDNRGYIYIRFDSIKYTINGNQMLYGFEELKSDLGANAHYPEDSSYVQDVYWVELDKGKKLLFDPRHRLLRIGEEQKENETALLFWKNDRLVGALVDAYIQDNDVKRNGTYKSTAQLTSEMISNLDTKENELYALIDNDKFTFGFVTDNHQTGFDVNNYRPDYTGMAYARVTGNLNVDANINGGDQVLSAGGALNALRKGFEFTPAKDFIYCEGNHDRYIVDPILSKKDYYNIVNRAHRNDPTFSFGDPYGGEYFYKNFDDKKIRVVVLDLYDIGAEHDADYNLNAGYRQNQLEWLANEALQVESGWQVMLITHSSPIYGMPENNRGINCEPLMQVLEAFKTGINATITATDKVYNDGTFDINFTTNFKTAGTLIAVMSGHAHNDYSIIKNGINYIQTICGYIDILLYHAQNDQPAKYGQRDQHTYSAIAFDIGIVDTVAHTINFKRFGYGHDRKFTY
ncbi:hypothetical protein [Latilactobacillus sakei]|uniref:hypothetical protein n=1 Tax=Latilactobacillus sakei TaxID=1599 RepID=UPI003F52A9CB